MAAATENRTNGAVANVATRKPRGANKAKAENISFSQNGDAFTLMLGTLSIPLDLDNIRTIVWNRIMAGGPVQVTFTNNTK